MTATVGPAPDARPATPPPRSGFREDIQGLRAVAVLLVLGYHAGVPQLAGGFVGVDVFFVISGYLITGLILREVETTGSLDLGRFYARRARRLLPASAVVLAASAAITLAVVPVTRWASIVWDLITSALYVTNWWIADQAVDYLAADTAPSPVQHFWTLAVEEQFYLVWPLLMLALVLTGRRTGWKLRPLLFGGISSLAAASLAWSVHLTTAVPARAYVVTTTRVWELAIGAILAFVTVRATRLSTPSRGVLAIGGLVAIGYAAVTFGADTPFPGTAALVPTLGTAAVIAAGTGAAAPGDPLLSNRPMRAIGGLSYSLYLWHWPLLVGAREVFAGPGEPLPVGIGLAVVAASAIPAWLTFRFVEAPIHHAPRLAQRQRGNLVVAVICTLVGLAAGGVVAWAIPEGTDPGERSGQGAAVLADPEGSPIPAEAPAAADLDEIVPDPIAALEDIAELAGQDCILPIETVTIDPCTYGPPDAETTVAVVGDSKMHQWLPAVEAVADERGWRVVTHLVSGCPLVRARLGEPIGNNERCMRHNELRYEELLVPGRYDLVLTSQRLPAATTEDGDPAAGRRVMVEDLRRTWGELREVGSEVIVVLDNPAPPMTVPDCVADRPASLDECSFPRRDGVAGSAAPTQREALGGTRGVGVVDLEDWICPADTCPPVIGEVLVYRQGSHLTATYVESLTAPFARAIAAALEEGRGAR